ncbi:MAG: PorT family protein [Chitinophagaceae bacterium]|nr:MAG: PorT family protein [Chitinophagaceae bacterium]
MNFKRIAIGALSILLASSVMAQKSSAIIRGGVNFANISNSDDGGTSDSRMLTSWQAGIIGDLNLTDFLAIQPGLLYTSKGVKVESGDGALYQKLTFNPQYLEVPVNLVFKTPTGNAKFFVGAGPYAAVGIAGKFKGEGVFGFSNKIEYSDDDPLTAEEEGAGAFRVKRFDYGLNGLVGIEASNLVITANYGLGLAKIRSGADSNDNDNNKHRVFSLTLGFKL